MAPLSGPMKCLKCSVFILNVICLLCAIILIAAGAYVEVQFVQYGGELHKVWQAAPIAVIVVGSIIFLVSFLGCCGAIKGNVCMLYMYAVLLVLLLIAELAAAIVAVIYKDKIRDEVEVAFNDAAQSYTPEDPKEIKKFIDAIQTTFECCVKTNKAFADTCVHPDVDCVTAFSDYLKRNLVILACVAFGVCFFQLLSIIIACCLGQRIREYENV